MAGLNKRAALSLSSCFHAHLRFWTNLKLKRCAGFFVAVAARCRFVYLCDASAPRIVEFAVYPVFSLSLRERDRAREISMRMKFVGCLLRAFIGTIYLSRTVINVAYTVCLFSFALMIDLFLQNYTILKNMDRGINSKSR